MSNKRYTDAERSHALKLYRDGYGYLKISQVLGCYETTVRKWVEKAGLKKHPKPDHSKVLRDNAISYYKNNDVTVTACADRYKVSTKTMTRWLFRSSTEVRAPKVNYNRKEILEDLKTMNGVDVAQKHGCSESYVSALRNGRI